MREKLIKLCVDIYAHSELDWEVTLSGNGTNPSEASNVAGEVLAILGVTRHELSTDIKRRVNALRKQHG